MPSRERETNKLRGGKYTKFRKAVTGFLAAAQATQGECLAGTGCEGLCTLTELFVTK